jgi:glutamate---cysteine ligase / carboxylate-amine ligase
MTARKHWKLFEAFGVELEYMLVDANSLDVQSACDQILADAAGRIESEVSFGPIAWSNELALHVIELKTDGPAANLAGLDRLFQEHVGRVNSFAAGHGWRLMPGAMHPWMDPDRELKLWPHEHNAVYEAYNRIFDCRGHGWSNLQSVHLNLPFDGDEEFARLHTAIRLVLPLLPALAASSPVYAGRISGLADSRLEFYRTNSSRIPSLTAGIIPEPVTSRASYQREIFDRIYSDIGPHDPGGVLRDEFLNSRGAIARFGRGSIEIRILDIQECPLADLAIAELVVAVLKELVAGRWTALEDQLAVPGDVLRALMSGSIRDAELTTVEDSGYLRQFGATFPGMTMGAVWRHLAADLAAAHPRLGALQMPGGPLDVIFRQGTLSTRLVRELGPEPSRERLAATWLRLCDCLALGRVFRPAIAGRDTAAVNPSRS